MTQYLTTPDPADYEYRTTAEIRGHYKISYRTLGRWLKRGLSFRQLSPKHKILIRLHDVEQFLGATRQAQPVDLTKLVNDVLADFGQGGGTCSKPREVRE